MVQGFGEAVNGFDNDDLHDSSFSDENISADKVTEMVNAMVREKFQNHPLDMYKAVAEHIVKLGPLGLKLHKTPDFMDSIEMALVQEQYMSSSSNESDHGGSRKLDYKHYMSQPEKEKLKASNFPAKFLKIGSWQVLPINDGDLVAKCYFAKRKLVWEILDTQLKIKRKIEILWSHISAIRSTSCQDNRGVLEIELNQPPTFFQEQNPQPRKHSIWSTITDFTQGQALQYRIHYLVFPLDKLGQTYEKILQADSRLHQLSQQPFPSAESPFFAHLCCFRYSLDFNRNRSDAPQPALPYRHPSMSMLQQGLCVSTSPDSGMSSSNSSSYHRVDENHEMNQRLMGYWNQVGINSLVNVPPMSSNQIYGLQVQDMDTNTQMNQAYPSQDYDQFSTYNEAVLPPDHPDTRNGYANSIYTDHHQVLDDHMPESNIMMSSSSSLVQESGIEDFGNEYSTCTVNANNSWT